MPEVNTKLTELKNPDVRFVSFVKRASSRLPFRVVKSDLLENDMVNLGTLGTLFKSHKSAAKPAAVAAPAGPEILGVVLNTVDEAALGKVAEVLKGLDLVLPKVVKSEDGATTTFSVDGELDKDVSLVKLSENVALVMKGFNPYGESFTKESTFGELAATRGFYSNVESAARILADSVTTNLYGSTTKAEAVSAVDKVMGEFSGYVKALANALPEKAFKADTALAALIPAPVEVEKGDKAPPAEKAKPKDPKDMTPEEKAAWAAEQEAAKSKKSDEVVAAEAAKKAEADAQAAALTAAITAALAPVTKSVADVAENLQKLQESTAKQIDEIARKSETALTAVKSTVVASAKADDAPAPGDNKEKTEKSDYRTGAFDSAFPR